MSAICTPHTRKDGKFVKYKKVKYDKGRNKRGG